jgi:glycosyltransferase involved in cell wall biosynthesis
MNTRVLFLPDWYPSAGNPISGIFVQEHVKAAQLYDDVAVMYGEGISRSEGASLISGIMEANIPTFRFRIPKLKIPKMGLPLYFWAVIKAYLFIKKNWGTIEVIHAQEPKPAFAALILRKLFGIPYVVSEHSTSFPKRTLSPLEVKFAQLAYSRASCVLGASAKFPIDFQYYSIECFFRWLPNCVDSTLFFPTGQKREFLVLHCSLFDEKKRVSDLIEAFAAVQKKFPEARLELIGDGPERGRVQELAQKMLIPGSFLFRGFQPKPVVARAMRRASLFVLPSEAENLPCVLIEAMSCGTPVVATNVGDIDHIVGEKQGILVNPGDILCLAAAIEKVLTGEKNFNHRDIAEYAANNFSREVIGRILHEEHIRAVTHAYRPNKSFQEINSRCRI